MSENTNLQTIQGMLINQNVTNNLLAFFNNDANKFEKFKTNLLSIVTNNKDIQTKCDVNSIMRSAKALSEVDIDLNPLLGQCYIVRYGNEAKPVISHRGWLTLLERAGKLVKTYSVFKCDEFNINCDDFDEVITFKPDYTQRKSSDTVWYYTNILGVLVKIKDIKTGNVKNTFVPADKIERIRAKSAFGKGDNSVYNQWAEEMGYAKAIKYVLSREAFNIIEINKAIAMDNELDIMAQQDEQKSKKTKLSDLTANVKTETVSVEQLTGTQDITDAEVIQVTPISEEENSKEPF